MTARSLALACTLVLAGPALTACAEGPRVSSPPATVATVPNDSDDETRAERYARGEYRRGFKHDAARNAEFCRLNPADTDCIGRRY